LAYFCRVYLPDFKLMLEYAMEGHAVSCLAEHAMR
jgi:hypothetical protein